MGLTVKLTDRLAARKRTMDGHITFGGIYDAQTEAAEAGSVQRDGYTALARRCEGLTTKELRQHLDTMNPQDRLRLFAHSHGKLKEAARRAIQRRRYNAELSDRTPKTNNDRTAT